MKMKGKKALAWLLAAALGLPGALTMAQEAEEPWETEPSVQIEETGEQPLTEEEAKTVGTDDTQDEPETVIGYWPGEPEETEEWQLDDGSSEDDADPDEAGPEEDSSGDENEPDEDSGDMDADDEDPDAEGLQEPEELSDGVSPELSAGDAVRKAAVTSSLDGLDRVKEDTEAVLTAVLYGFSDEDTYTVQWQYSPDGGETVFDAEDGTELEYHYTVTEETIQYSWRVVITIEKNPDAQPDLDNETEDEDTQE